MAKLKGIFFFILTAICIIAYVVYVLLAQLFKIDLPWAIRVRQSLARSILAINGIKREVKGKIPEGTYLFISNHRTYLDPVMQAPEAAFVPVAMSEIADWPIMGRGIKATGIVFVKRESKSSREATREAVAKTLKEGTSVIVYPEGTTGDLPTTKEFKLGTFRIAAANKFPIIPMAVDYKDPAHYWTSNQSFVGHVIDSFGKKMDVKVSYGEPVVNENPEALHEAVQSWINKELLRMRVEWEQS